MAADPGTTMLAAQAHRYGGPHVVDLREVERPSPMGTEILVRVRAASVNRADLDGLYPRWQFTRLFFGLRRPKVPWLGIDVAGVVEAVGPDATRFKPGDRVFADLFGANTGSFAEYACAPEGRFQPIPEGMSFEDAAAIPHSAILALQGLRLRDGRTIRAGDDVLVVGASGNVGPYAVQIARSMGATVTGVARTEKLDFVRSLGANRVIDYTTTDYTRTGDRYDWVLDVDAHHLLPRWRSVLKPGGAYVAHGGSTAWLLSVLLFALPLRLATGKSMGLLLWWKPFDAGDVATLNRLYAEGVLRPHIDRVFPLREIAAAIDHVDAGHSKGKVLITP